MRTSNKILLGTLVAILVIITAIHAALYTKYKRNDFTTMKSLHHERYDVYDMKGVLSVSFVGLQNVTIIPADTARLEIQKGGFFKVHYQFENGVLTVKGDSIIKRNNNNPERVRSYQDVILYLPHIQNIKTDFSELVIRANKSSVNVDSIVLELNESTLRLSDENGTVSRFNKITVAKANKSTIETGNINVTDLTLNLEDSRFEEGNMTSDLLTINTDKKSTLKLSGRNIANAKIVLKP